MAYVIDWRDTLYPAIRESDEGGTLAACQAMLINHHSQIVLIHAKIVEMLCSELFGAGEHD